METNYITKRLKLIWPLFALLMLVSFSVDAQEKAGRILELTIECEGVVKVKDVDTDQVVATIQGPTSLTAEPEGYSQVEVSAGQLVQFITTDAGLNDDNCLKVLRWTHTETGKVIGEEEDLLNLTHIDGNALAVPMTGDNLKVTAHFGAPVEDYALNLDTDVANDGISTISGTPIIVKADIEYGTVSPTADCEDYFDDWVHDIWIEFDELPANGKILETTIEFWGIDHNAIEMDAEEFAVTGGFWLFEDLLGWGSLPLDDNYDDTEMTFTFFANPDVSDGPVTYTVDLEWVAWNPEDSDQCWTQLGYQDFDITYGEATISTKGVSDCSDELCFVVDLTYPDIARIGEKLQEMDDYNGYPFGDGISDDILWNILLEGPPFEAGTTLTVDIAGYGSQSWTLSSAINLDNFYLSNIWFNSVSDGFEFNDDWKIKDDLPGTVTICVTPAPWEDRDFTIDLTAMAQLEIAQGDWEDDPSPYYLKAFDDGTYKLIDFPYDDTSVTLKRYPSIFVEYQRHETTTATDDWENCQHDAICGLQYELRARFEVDGEPEVDEDDPHSVKAWELVETRGEGKWKLVSGPGSVTFGDKYELTSGVQVSSFGEYTFKYDFEYPGIPDGCLNVGSITVGFYPDVVSSLEIEPEDAAVCSLKTWFEYTKGIDTYGNSNNFSCTKDYYLKDHWVVERYKPIWDDEDETYEWGWYKVSNPLDYLNITGEGDCAGTYDVEFDATHDTNYPYGRYRVTHHASMEGYSPGPCSHTKERTVQYPGLCESTPQSIEIELFWKPLAKKISKDFEPCDLDESVEIKMYEPLRYNARHVLDDGNVLVINPYANGIGTWNIVEKPEGATLTPDPEGSNDWNLEFTVDKPGAYALEWVVTNEHASTVSDIPCDSDSKILEFYFYEEPVATVHNNDMIHCFTQVKWEPFMDIITGDDAYENDWFTGAADEAERIRIYENWVTNYEGNVIQLDAETYPATASGEWSYEFTPYGEDIYDYEYFEATGLDEVYFVVPEEGETPDPRKFETWVGDAEGEENAIAVILVPGKFEFTWEISKDCPDFEDSDSFEVEFLPSPKPLKILEVTDQGEVVPPRPVCLDEEVHYILRRTDGQEPTVDPEKRDVFWHIPDNFEVLAQGGGAGTDQYWVKGVWTDDVEGAHFEVEEVRYTLHGCKTVNTFDPIEYKPYIESVEIVGNELVPVGIVQEYEAEVELLGDYEDATVEFTWTITGGEILSGQGTSEIEVMWDEDFEDDLTLKVVAHGLDFCNEQEDEITVEIEEGKIVGQIRYWNPEETAMPSPFKTIIDEKPIADYFYVELWTADEDGDPVGMVTRTAARDMEEPRYDAYFEFEDIDLNLDYVLYVYDGSYDREVGLEDGQLGFAWTWNNWGGVTIRDAFAISRMSVGVEISEDPYNWTWVGSEEDDYGFFAHALADVNSDGDISSSDAFWVVQRILGREATFGDYSPNFKAAGRLVESLDDKTWDIPFSHDNDEDIEFVKLLGEEDDNLYQGTSPAAAHGFVSQVIPFNGQAARDIVIYYGATGDVSASYRSIESGYKKSSDVDLAYTGIIETTKDEVIEIPVRVSDATNIGAMLVGLTYDNSLIEVTGVDAEMYNIVNEEGWLRVSDMDVNGRSFGANQKLFTVTARIIGDIEGETELFAVEDVTEIIDPGMNGLDITLNTDFVSTTPVSVIDTEATDIAISNFPNPFNQATTIEYTLPESGKVTLVVYNQVGQVVNTLVSETQEAGHRSIEVTSSDLGSGEGLFIYRITVEGQSRTYTATGNMILMK